jgi:hypothetical protein
VISAGANASKVSGGNNNDDDDDTITPCRAGVSRTECEEGRALTNLRSDWARSRELQVKPPPPYPLPLRSAPATIAAMPLSLISEVS